MKCKLPGGPLLIDAHFAGSISPARERELRSHLPACETCRRLRRGRNRRRFVQRRLVVGAAQRCAVEDVQTAVLVGRDNHVLPFVLKSDRIRDERRPVDGEHVLLRQRRRLK